MPNVTAPTRTMNNGEAITYFTDTVGTSSVTWTYQNEQEGLTVTNKGVSNLTLTVNGVNYTITPGGVQTVSAVFTAFTIVSASGTQQFDAHAWSFQKDVVQLSGSNVIKEWLGQNQHIAGNTIYNYGQTVTQGAAGMTPFDISKSRNVYLRIKNTYDVSLYAYLRIFDNAGKELYVPVSADTIAAGATKEYYVTNKPLIYATVQIYTSPKPTTGSVDILLIGGWQ